MPSFQIFGSSHIIVLFLTLIFCLGIYYSKSLLGSRRIFEYVLISFLFLTEVIYYISIYQSNDPFTQYLPFHISQIVLWLAIGALLTKNVFLHTLSFWLGFWSVPLALFLPELYFQFPHPRFIEFFLGYSILMAYFTYLLRFRLLDIGYKKMLMSYFVLAGIALVMFFINLSLNTNFLFVRTKPEGGQMDFLPEFPSYIFVIGLGLIILYHIVWILLQKTYTLKK